MDNFIEKLKDRVLPSQVISRYVNLKQQPGLKSTGLCPFHNEKTPSFWVYDSQRSYHCFGCGAHGDVISFLMERESLDFMQALEVLAKEAGMEIPKKEFANQNRDKHKVLYEIFELATSFYEECLYAPEGQAALNYLRQQRSLSDETIKACRLGFAPRDSAQLYKRLSPLFKDEDIIASTVMRKGKYNDLFNQFRGRIIFPITDHKNRMVAFGGRILPTDDSSNAKYINSPENPIFHKSDILYNFSNARKAAFHTQQIIVCEGYMDVIALRQVGIENAVAPLGANVKVNQIQMLWQVVPEPVICMDSDAAGKRAQASLADNIMEHLQPGLSISFCNLKGGKDPDEVITKHGVQAFKKQLSQATPLADAIFAMQLQKQEINTPERQANLLHRLESIAHKIKHEQLKKSYLNHLKSNFYDFLRASKRNLTKKSYNVEKKEELKIPNIVYDQEHHIVQSLYVLAQYPELLSDIEIYNLIHDVDISSQHLDKLRNYILFVKDGIQEEKLSELDLLADIKGKFDIKADEIGGKAVASAEKAREYIIRVMTINELQCIVQQVKEAEKALLENDSDERIYERLIYLKNCEEEIRKRIVGQ
jgi:DNA primase